MKRILIYTHDTYGLGNTRRMLVIARHLVQSDDTISVLMVSGSTMLHTFRHGPQVDYIKLPCLSRNTQGKYQSRYLNYDYDQLIGLRSCIIESAIANFKPDILLVDKKPRGVSGELSHSLEYIQEHLPDTRCVLLLRDILDTPARTAYIWHSRGYFDDIETYYDRVLVVGAKEVYNLCEVYRFPAKACDRVQYCGYLAREPGRKGRVEIRKQFQAGNQPLVLAMAGGGEDGFHLLETFLTSARTLTQRAEFTALVILGSEMPATQQLALRNQASGIPNVTLLDFTDDLMSLIDASDLVVSMAGYNTVCEFLTLNKPAIVVPRTQPSQEQWIRAKRMHDLGILSAIHPDQLSPPVLMEEIDALLISQTRQLPATQLDMNGLVNVTSSVLTLLEVEKQEKHDLPGLFTAGAYAL